MFMVVLMIIVMIMERKTLINIIVTAIQYQNLEKDSRKLANNSISIVAFHSYYFYFF
jgi:hypothetical protein